MQRIFFPSSKPRFVDAEGVIKEFRELAKKLLLKNKNVEAVRLFGSYAQGNAGLHSDADILVVLLQDKCRPIERLDEFILEFSNGPIPADVVVYTKAEIDKALKDENRFLSNAIRGIRLI